MVVSDLERAEAHSRLDVRESMVEEEMLLPCRSFESNGLRSVVQSKSSPRALDALALRS